MFYDPNICVAERPLFGAAPAPARLRPNWVGSGATGRPPPPASYSKAISSI